MELVLKNGQLSAVVTGHGDLSLVRPKVVGDQGPVHLSQFNQILQMP